MGEPVFLKATRGLTLGEIAALTGAAMPTGIAPERRFTDIAPLDRAGPAQLSFYDNPRYQAAAAATHAGACLVGAKLAGALPSPVAALIVAEPYRAFIAVARAMFPQSLRPSSLYAAGAAAGAYVHESARLEAGVTIEPGAVIGSGAAIGGGTLIAANAVIGPQVCIGRDCAIGAGTAIGNALIGDRVIVHPGCSIGQDGFGFLMGNKGHLKVPQVGRVIIQDDVEIGAGTAIDRGAIRDTVIGEGTKIDNLVQVGHNVTIGRHCVVVAQTGIAGSSILEDFVVLGAQAGLSDNTKIGEGTQIAAASGVHGEIPAGTRWGGYPAKPMKQWMREIRVLERLTRGKTAEDAAKDE
jgi:UDP-3-O-[3-hydroxymyristoyl] glucosamine N-acyltransferase